jgi:hypothetical protein
VFSFLPPESAPGLDMLNSFLNDNKIKREKKTQQDKSKHQQHTQSEAIKTDLRRPR